MPKTRLARLFPAPPAPNEAYFCLAVDTNGTEPAPGATSGKALLTGTRAQPPGSPALLLGVYHGVFPNFPAGIHERGMQNAISVL